MDGHIGSRVWVFMITKNGNESWRQAESLQGIVDKPKISKTTSPHLNFENWYSNLLPLVCKTEMLAQYQEDKGNREDV